MHSPTLRLWFFDVGPGDGADLRSSARDLGLAVEGLDAVAVEGEPRHVAAVGIAFRDLRPWPSAALDGERARAEWVRASGLP